MRLRPSSAGLPTPAVSLLLLLVGVTASGCGGGDAGDAAGGDPEADRPSTMGEASVYTSEDGAVSFTLPERWGGEVSIRETEPADLEWTPPAPEQVFQFLLQPRDPRFATENLFNVYVYEVAVWDGPARAWQGEIGVEVERRGDRVFVLGAAGTNPFPAGSVDHGRFDRYRMDAAEIREALGG